MITAKGKGAQNEEEELANLSWFIDLTAMDTTIPDTYIRPKQTDMINSSSLQVIKGVNFDFEEGCSIKTTRVNSTTNQGDTKETEIITPSSSILKNNPSARIKNNDDQTITSTSEITTDTHLQVLESNMGTLGGTMGKVLNLLEEMKATNLNSLEIQKSSTQEDGRQKVL